MFVRILVLGLLCAWTMHTEAYASDPGRVSWQTRERQARVAIAAKRWNQAASAVVAAMQDLQGQTVREDDPVLEVLFAADIPAIMMSYHNEAAAETIAKWKFAVSERLFGKHSVPYADALTDMYLVSVHSNQTRKASKFMVEKGVLMAELQAGPKAALWKRWDTKRDASQKKQTDRAFSEVMKMRKNYGLEP